MNQSNKDFASTAVIVGTGILFGVGMIAANSGDGVYGTPFSYSGQKYYVRDGSQRVVYPDYETCMREVPASLQSECEPVSNYHSTTGYGRYYGPVYHPSDTTTGYNPDGRYPVEAANSSNMGQRLPASSNKYGFGSTGKAHTSSSFHSSGG